MFSTPRCTGDCAIFLGIHVLHSGPNVLILTVALCGCATTVTWRQREGLDYFVGKSEGNVLGSLGEPTRVWTIKDLHYIAYDYKEKIWVPGEPGFRDPNTGRSSRPWVDRRKCSTVFELRESHVIAWSVDGDACHETPFPWVQHFASGKMAKAAKTGVQSVTQFPDDPFTGSSTVIAGEFYSK